MVCAANVIMAASDKASEKSTEPSVSDLFESMSYGPAPEADNVVQAWLKDKDRAFGHFINGEYIYPTGRKTYNCQNPATGQLLATTIRGNSDDVDLAVKAARTAYTTWSKTKPHERARHLYSIARHVQKHIRLFAVLESMDNGKTVRETRDADIPIVVRHLYHYAGWAQLSATEMRDWRSIGVVGAIVPWNFPLMLLTWKLAPALAMGNTVVLKPASYTSLSAFLLAEICIEAGLPPGVFNVVTGNGAFGSELAGHPDIDKVAFTGSTLVGQKLRRLTAGTGKKISLELGGKSPFVVFDSADLDSAVEGVVNAIWFNQGQVCSAGSKLLVQETIFDEMISKIKERLRHFRVGNNLDKTMDMGAIVDEAQKATVEEYVESARSEGAEIFQAFACKPDSGCFYPPTLITNVQTSSRVVQDEIFGPVLVALPFRTAKEAVSLSNNTRYGLAGSVWTENVSLSLEVSLLIKAGTIWINSHNVFDAAAGFGGYKESGFGRDGGKEGLYEYARPAWQERARPTIAEMDYSTFGATLQSRPSFKGNTNMKLESGLISVDHTYKFYYGGAQKRPDAPYMRPVLDADSKVMAHVGEGNRKDVRNAVEAAQKAAPGWGKRAAYNRSQIIYYMAENLEQRRSEFADKLLRQTGKALVECLREVDMSIERLFHWAAYADKYGGNVQETTLYGATVKIHEPVGVVAILCPDEYPLLGFVSLLSPAIVRSNCVIIVPSVKHPISALDFYQVFDTSDIPGGVVNILTGDRDHLAKYLVEHQDVQAVWYFGGEDGSKYVEHMSAENVKRTWVNYGLPRDWTDPVQGAGEEFLHQSCQVKNIWIPMGDIYAN